MQTDNKLTCKVFSLKTADRFQFSCSPPVLTWRRLNKPPLPLKNDRTEVMTPWPLQNGETPREPNRSNIQVCFSLQWDFCPQRFPGKQLCTCAWQHLYVTHTVSGVTATIVLNQTDNCFTQWTLGWISWIFRIFSDAANGKVHWGN